MSAAEGRRPHVIGAVASGLFRFPVAVARSVTRVAWAVVRSEVDPVAERAETNRLLAALLDALERANVAQQRTNQLLEAARTVGAADTTPPAARPDVQPDSDG